MKSRLRLFCFGKHRQRIPVNYPALASGFADKIELVSSPAGADLHLFAHNLDLNYVPRDLITHWRQKQTPIVLLSEEPFWDTIWGRDPLRRHRVMPTPFGPVPVQQLNHTTSDIYAFKRIPYYLLTNHRFASMYARRFTRNLQRSHRNWKAHFTACQTTVCFMFERRPEPHHAIAWPEQNLFGLCDWRTHLAETCQTGTVERLGQSWEGGSSRFDIHNWYLDKMVQLDGRSQMMGAIENTHHPDYITEKFFDAFANGALPLYWANPVHRIHEFGLPAQAWINLHGQSPEEAAAQIADFKITAEVREAYHHAQEQLAHLFGTPEYWVAEREHLCQSVVRSLEAALTSCPVMTGQPTQIA